MIYYVNTGTGRIEGGASGDSPESLNGITSVPAGCVAVFVDDNLYPDVYADQSNYIIENGAPVYSEAPPTPPQTPEPTTDERLRSLEDAMTILMGL